MAVVPKSIGRIGSRRTTIALLLIVWLGVVVIGAGPTADSATWIGIPSFDWLNYVFAGLIVLGGIIIVASLFLIPKSEDAPPPRRRPIWPILLVALLFLLLARRDLRPEGTPVDAPPPIEVTEPEPSRGSDRGNGVGGRELAVLIVILAAATGIVLWSRRGLAEGGQTQDDDLSLERALAPAVERAAEQLLTGTDPRSAVLMAYRSLETALEQQGLPREQTETHAEHLLRVLADLPLDTQPLVTLSELYLQARFSTHAISADDQRTAATALDRIREQLAPVATATIAAADGSSTDTTSTDPAKPGDRRR